MPIKRAKRRNLSWTRNGKPIASRVPLGSPLQRVNFNIPPIDRYRSPSETSGKHEKRIPIGRVNGSELGYNRSLLVTLDIELRNETKGKVLSISGDVWNPNHTDIVTGGQIDDSISRWLDEDKFVTLYMPSGELRNILGMWGRWHLNNMNAGCEHQRKLLPAIEKKFGDDFLNASNYDNIIKLPQLEKCSVCGYKYGSAWKFEKLPPQVERYAESLIGIGVDDYQNYARLYSGLDKKKRYEIQEKMLKEDKTLVQAMHTLGYRAGNW